MYRGAWNSLVRRASHAGVRAARELSVVYGRAASGDVVLVQHFDGAGLWGAPAAQAVFRRIRAAVHIHGITMGTDKAAE